MNGRRLVAPQLWALAHASEARNLGKPAQVECSECHWCGNPCSREFCHDDLPPMPFVVSKARAARPANPWICNGCRLFRRRGKTVRFLSDRPPAFRDGQHVPSWGWWLTERGAWGLRREDAAEIYGLLLEPPLTFCLAFLDWRRPGEKTENLVHLWPVNDLDAIEAGTPLAFAVNNVAHEFSPYELRQALSNRNAPASAGVKALVELLGPHPELEALKGEPGKPGDLRGKDGPKKVINPGKG